MLVVVVSDSSAVNGGAAQVAVRSAQGLARAGHEVVLFAGHGPAVPGVTTVSLGLSDLLGDRFRARAAANGLWNRRAAAGLDRLLQGLHGRGEVVVHVHSWVKCLSPAIFPVLQKHAFPVVCTLHDYFWACPNGGFFDYPGARICERRPLSAACLAANCDSRSYAHKAWRVLRQFVQRAGLGAGADAMTFVAVSDFSAEILRRYLGPAARLRRVDNPIAATPLPPADPAASRQVAFVGRLSPEKGPEPLARAAARAAVDVVFMGEGACAPALARAPGRIELTGWLKSDEVLARLRACRALVLPSLWYETQGLVVLEAAALGVPAIVPTRCAAADYVADGVTGLHFRSGDETSLYEALLRTRDDAAMRRLGAGAYAAYWADPRSDERHVAQLEAVYGECLGTGHAPV